MVSIISVEKHTICCNWFSNLTLVVSTIFFTYAVNLRVQQLLDIKSHGFHTYGCRFKAVCVICSEGFVTAKRNAKQLI